MKKQIKKLTSLTLALILTFTLFSSCLSVSAKMLDLELGTVRVIIENQTFSTADEAPWAGVLIDTDYIIDVDSDAQNVVENVMKNNRIDYTMNNWGYLASVNGLSEYAANNSGGWMITINDWFTDQGASYYKAVEGGISDGDLIRVLYSCSWGADVGSVWGNSDTKLASLDVSGASLDSAFEPDKAEYKLVVNSKEKTEINLTPKAANKNYQVRTYLNNYTPSENGTELKTWTKNVSVNRGDTIYIGVGDENWPSMNDKVQGNVYKLSVVYQPLKGDVNLDGKVDINDATLVQKYIADIEKLDEDQLLAADVDKDGEVKIADATAIQKIVAEIY